MEWAIETTAIHGEVAWICSGWCWELPGLWGFRVRGWLELGSFSRFPVPFSKRFCLLLRNISSFPAMPCPKCHQFNTNALLSSARACYVSGPRTLQSLHRSDAFCRGAAPLVFTMRYPMVPMLFGDQAGIMFVQTISVCLQNKCEKFEKEFGVKKRSAFYPKLSWVYILGSGQGISDGRTVQVTFGSRKFGISGNYFVWWMIVICYFHSSSLRIHTWGCSWGG